MRRVFIFLSLTFCGSASAQFFSIGIKAGIPLTNAYQAVNTGYVNASEYDRLYIVGPTAEVHLPFHLGIEVDALYRRNGFGAASSASASLLVGAISYAVRVNDWQFPVLAKWEPGHGPIRPFVDGGLTLRDVSESGLSLSPNNPNAGITLGGGLTFKLLLLRISPEIRYTHWDSQAFVNTGNVTGKSNQADFLVGFTF